MANPPADSAKAASASSLAASALLGELERLVQAASGRAGLSIREGKPDCCWSFDWVAGVVTVNPNDLRTFAPDLCRGLALHEATHAAVTVLQDILPRARLGSLLPLLNSIEDIRIEIWMRRRFPGAAPWIRAYNDVLYGQLREEPMPASRQAQFLRGILELWWLGTATPGMSPEVEKALASCQDAISAATACQPPLDHDRRCILTSQMEMWEIVQQRILPTWERLVNLDRCDGMPRLVADVSTVACRRIGPRGPSNPREAIANRLGTNGFDGYTAAWRRMATQADRLGDALLRILVPQQRMRWTTGHASGTRLDLRRAMQFDTDPQLYRSLWCRPVLPQRCDPALLLLIDRSSSMRDANKIDHAFDGLVLMLEVCRRIGVPLAVWSFANRCRQELDWEQPLDAATRHRLGLLPWACDGSTAMSRALDDARSAFAGRHGDPKILFVLGDGDPDKPDATREAVGRLERDGIRTIGLGLGAGTAGLARFFHSSIIDIHPAQLVQHMSVLLGHALSEDGTLPAI